MNTAIILAAGKGLRLGSKIPKQFISFKDRMIIDYSISAFHINKNINDIIIICNPEWTGNLKKKYPHMKIVDGGENRTKSSFIGLQNCNPTCSKVLIHDAARPFISQKIINDCFKYLDKFDCAIPVIDTENSLINQKNNIYLNRDDIKIIQTPQSFNFQLIKKSYIKINDIKNSLDQQFTDDLSVLINHYKNPKIKLFNGEKSNFKITTNEELERAKFFLK